MNASKAIASIVLVGMGMAGIYLKIEYSGWVIFLGAAVALN